MEHASGAWNRSPASGGLFITSSGFLIIHPCPQPLLASALLWSLPPLLPSSTRATSCSEPAVCTPLLASTSCRTPRTLQCSVGLTALEWRPLVWSLGTAREWLVWHIHNSFCRQLRWEGFSPLLIPDLSASWEGCHLLGINHCNGLLYVSTWLGHGAVRHYCKYFCECVLRRD